MATYVNELGDNAMDIDGNVAPPRKYLIDNPALHVPRKNGEIQTFLKDCMSMSSAVLDTFFTFYVYVC